MNTRAGFTLIEVLLVITIVSILSAVIIASLNQGTAVSRDAERKADLRNLQSAIELYKNRYGRYPEGCNGAGNWSGQNGSSAECTSGSEYIVGLAPEFIPALPKDPKLNGADSGYMYVTNADGSSYKMLVKNTVESEEVTDEHPFKSCDYDFDNAGKICDDPPDDANPDRQRCDLFICNNMYQYNAYNSLVGGGGAPTACGHDNAQFRTSYAVWGGWAPATAGTPGSETYTVSQEKNTEAVWCKT